MHKTLQVVYTITGFNLSKKLFHTRRATISGLSLSLCEILYLTCCCLFFLFLLDGVFGRCQQLAGADLHTYDISSSALQRLRILLQKLAQRGANCLSVSAWVSFCSDQHQLCAGLPANAIV